MPIQPIGTQPVYQPPEVARTAPAQPAPAAEQSQSARKFDRYTPENPADTEPAGLYWISHDEEGNPSVQMDRNAAPKAEQTTVNTDRVDREIEQLRKKLEQLQAELRTAAPDRQEALERRCRQVEQELAQKDNDTYRRQNAVFR